MFREKAILQNRLWVSLLPRKQARKILLCQAPSGNRIRDPAHSFRPSIRLIERYDHINRNVIHILTAGPLRLLNFHLSFPTQ